MKFSAALILVTFVLGIKGCPDASLISPCTCVPGDKKAFLCTSLNINAVELQSMFHHLSDVLPDNKKHFHRLLIHYNNFDTIPANFLGDLTFNDIEIYSMHNLTKIDENAFTKTNFVTKTISIHHNNALSSYNTIFKVLSKFVNAERIILLNCNITEIPSNAFQPINGYQNKLTELILDSWMTKKMGSRAFAPLNHLTKLSLAIYNKDKPLEQVPDEAFYFEEASSEPIRIKLPATTLSKNALKDIKRPARLEYGGVSTVINETVFLPFLLQDDNNHLDLTSAKLDCQDCNNFWLTEFPELLPRIVFNSKAITCSNGKPVVDKDNFKNCKARTARTV